MWDLAFSPSGMTTHQPGFLRSYHKQSSTANFLEVIMQCEQEIQGFFCFKLLELFPQHKLVYPDNRHYFNMYQILQNYG